MNPINNPIRECLEKGEIRISSRSKLITIVLKNNGTVLRRIDTDKGIRYAFLKLIGEVTGSYRFQKMADTLYPYPLGPATTTELDLFVLDARYIRIYLQGQVIRIDAHQTSMPYLDSIPDLYYKTGSAKSFGKALKKMLKCRAIAELPVSNPN